MNPQSSSPTSSSSSLPSPTFRGPVQHQPLDAATQLQDIRTFERNIGKSVNSLTTLRRRYLVVVGLLVLSSIYWTWRLREKLTDNTFRTAHQTLRLWFMWALVGICPTVFFFVAMYQSTVVMPSSFVERLNRSLSDFHVAYAPDTGRLLRTARPQSEGSCNYSKPPSRVRPSSSYRMRVNRAGVPTSDHEQPSRRQSYSERTAREKYAMT